MPLSVERIVVPEYGAFRAEACSHFANVYRALQDQSGRLVPLRKSLDLRAVPGVAPYFGIFEVRSPQVILVRLAGTAFVNRTGINNTGKNALDLIPREMRDWTANHFLRMLKTPCGSVCVSREAYGDAQMLTEVISLPFADAQGDPNLIVSASIPFERPEFVTKEGNVQIGDFFDVVYFDIGAATLQDKVSGSRKI